MAKQEMPSADRDAADQLNRQLQVPRALPQAGLKVFHLVYSLDTGGMENGIVNLCNRLDASLIESTICVLKGNGALENRVDASRIEVICLRRNFGNDPSVPLRLAWLLRRRRFDILHSHNWVTLLEGFTAAKLGRVPKVIHGEHGYPLEKRPRNIRVQKYVWQRVSQVAAVSNSLADDIAVMADFPRDRIAVIPNGVDTATFRPLKSNRSELRARFHLPCEDLLIGMVARLDPIKNHAGVIRALAKMSESGTRATLVLAGDGAERKELEQLAAELGVAKKVIFLGDISGVDKLLPALDLFVLNSHSEGMSNTLLEAMAAGLPVIATRVGSNTELVVDDDSGYLVPPDDEVSLASALERLATNDGLRKRLGESARERVLEHYSIDAMVSKYTNLYLRVCGYHSPTCALHLNDQASYNR